MDDAFTARVNSCSELPRELDALTVNVNVPDSVALPFKSPFFALRLIPPERLPSITLKVIAFEPDTLNSCL